MKLTSTIDIIRRSSARFFLAATSADWIFTPATVLAVSGEVRVPAAKTKQATTRSRGMLDQACRAVATHVAGVDSSEKHPWQLINFPDHALYAVENAAEGYLQDALTLAEFSTTLQQAGEIARRSTLPTKDEQFAIDQAVDLVPISGPTTPPLETEDRALPLEPAS